MHIYNKASMTQKYLCDPIMHGFEKQIKILVRANRVALFKWDSTLQESSYTFYTWIFPTGISLADNIIFLK